MFGSKGSLATVLAVFGVLLFQGGAMAQPAKFFGSIWQWSSATDAPQSFTDLFDQTTPENAGKWGRAEPSRGNFNWTTLDAMYSWAETTDALVKQHTLVWGQQEPSWIGNYTDSDTVKAIVRTWITTYLKRYGSRTDMIDVVNEPLHAPASYRGHLGGDGATGWDWVIWIFQTARDSANVYAPQAKLLINDYSIIGDNGSTTNYLTLINLLKDRGLIDGIGEQAHFYEGADTSVLRANLDRLAATGLPIYISELDVDDANDQGQLASYQRLFPLFWDHPSVRGITLWGYQQGRIWRTNGYLLRSDGSERPAFTWIKQYIADNSPDPTMPYMEVVPSALTVDVDSGTSPAVQNLAVTNASVGTLEPLSLNVRYTAGNGWLAVQSTGAASGNTQQLSATIASASLPIGVYSAAIVVRAAGSLPDSLVIPVTLSVIAVGRGAVNAGGTAVAGGWGVDKYFTAGTVYGSSNSITTTGVANAAPASVYQSERFGSMAYAIPNLTAGDTYTVRLHFAELYWTSAGQRTFNVDINGDRVLNAFDIVAEAGAANKALVRDFQVAANSSGQIVIAFTSIVDNAKISGIEWFATDPTAYSSRTASPRAQTTVGGLTLFNVRGRRIGSHTGTKAALRSGSRAPGHGVYFAVPENKTPRTSRSRIIVK